MTDPTTRSSPDSDDLALSDQAELDRTLERYRPRLERMFVMRLDPRLARRIDVEDVIQEAFVDVTRRLDDYRSNRNMPFFLWVRLLTAQKMIELQRRHLGTLKRDATREQSVRAFPTASTISMAHALVDSATTPSGAALRRETRDRVQAALEALGTDDREVLALLYFEKLSNEEAASVMGLSYSGLRKRHVRALGRMRKELGDLGGLLDVVRGDAT